jgi:hypothetical protein
MPDPDPDHSDAALFAALARIEHRLTALEAGAVRLAPVLDRVAVAAAAFPGFVATAADTVDGWIAGLDATGSGADARVRAAGPLLERLSRPETVARLERLLDRLDVVGFLAGEALVETRNEAAAPVGFLGALAGLGRADVRRAVAFLLRFGVNFGRRLSS